MDDISSSSSDSWQLDSKMGLVDEDPMASSSSYSSSSSSSLPPKKASSWPSPSAGVVDGADQQVGPKEPTSNGEEHVLSFGSSEFEADFEGNGPAVAAGGGSKRTRSLSSAQEHVLAERRRRQKLTQMFLDLASVIPGLNKNDKVSIVEEAAKYIKQLEEQVKLLEQQTGERSTEESDGSSSCSDGKNVEDKVVSSESNLALEIKAKVSGEEILISIFSKKGYYDLVPKIFGEISKLHLSPLNTNIISFGKYALDVTIVAQMKGEFCMSMEHLVKQLHEALE